MRFSCQTSLFRQILNSVSYIIPSKPIHPTLGALALKGDCAHKRLNIQVFNLSEGLEFDIPLLNIERKFEALVPTTLVKLIKYITTDEIDFDINEDNTRLTINTGNGEVNLDLYAFNQAVELPNLNSHEGEPLVVDLENLAMAFNRVNCFVNDLSQTTGQQVLEGINFKNDKGLLTLSSTNGKTAAIAKIESHSDFALNKTISPKYLRLIFKVLNEFTIKTGSISLKIDETLSELSTLIQTDENSPIYDTIKVKVLGRIFQSPYPDIERLIPQSDKQVQLTAQSLMHYLNLLDCLKTTPVNEFKLFIEFNHELVKLNYTSIDGKTANSDIRLSYSNLTEPFKVLLNYDFIKKNLSALKDSTLITFKFCSNNKPVLLQGSQSEMEELGIIMPISLD